MNASDVVANSSQVPLSPHGRLQHDFSSSSYLLSDVEVLVQLVVILVFGFLGLLENLATIVFILRVDGYLDAASNIFLLSLATSDFLLCAFPAPMAAYIHFYGWNLAALIPLCKVLFVTTLGSIFLLTLDRAASVLLSIKYVSIMTVRRSVIVVLAFWVSDISYGVITYCSDTKPGLLKYFLSFFITGSFLMCIYMYVKSRQHERLIKKQRIAVAGETTDKQQDFRALKTIVMLAGSFMLGWLPMTSVLMFMDRSNQRNFIRSLVFTTPLALVNACLNPAIYFFRRDDFRRKFVRVKQRFAQVWSDRFLAAVLRKLPCPCSGKIDPV